MTVVYSSATTKPQTNPISPLPRVSPLRSAPSPSSFLLAQRPSAERCGRDFDSPDLDPDEFRNSRDDIDLATGLGSLSLLRFQQSKLVTMTVDRKVFEDRVKVQEKKWVSAFHLLGDQIRQMKVDLELKEMEGFVEVAKLRWALSMKRQEAYTTKLKLER
ncbi:hypothetical protein C1H46_010154 [Malus baccata]|uniref:Uncharacterized protein n=1 Tax=Malus baccata TaxID=106549 RepID=A0A540MZJ8_MALBA|nr:hypothetical protein C1H46_010154 [Malus baccata]